MDIKFHMMGTALEKNGPTLSKPEGRIDAGEILRQKITVNGRVIRRTWLGLTTATAAAFDAIAYDGFNWNVCSAQKAVLTLKAGMSFVNVRDTAQAELSKPANPEILLLPAPNAEPRTSNSAVIDFPNISQGHEHFHKL